MQPRIALATVLMSFFGLSALALSKTPTPSIAEIERLAVNHLQENAALFGLNDVKTSLVLSRSYADEEDQFLTYDVLRNGLRIVDAHILFRFKAGQLTQVVNQSIPHTPFPDEMRVSQLSTDQLQAIAKASILGTNAVSSGDDVLRVIKTKFGRQLIQVAQYRVNSSIDEEETFNVQIDKFSGKVIAKKSDIISSHSAVLNTRLYQKNYLGSLTTVPIKYLNIGGSKSATDKSGKFQFDDIADLVISGLDGKFVKINSRDKEHLQTKLTDLSQRLVSNQQQFILDVTEEADAKDSNNKLAQLMTYHHLNDVIDEGRTYAPGFAWLNKSIQVNVNIPSTSAMKCNAYYSNKNRSLNFFQAHKGKCANASLVADIMFHEWGHAFHDAASGIQDDALSEGFGDAVAMVMTGTSKLGEGFIEGRDVIRDASKVVKFPVESEDPHAVGMTLSGSMWGVYSGLKKLYSAQVAHQKFAKITFKMIFTARTLEESYEAVLAVDERVGTQKQSKHHCLINQQFAIHGLTEVDSKCK